MNRTIDPQDFSLSPKTVLEQIGSDTIVLDYLAQEDQ